MKTKEEMKKSFNLKNLLKQIEENDEFKYSLLLSKDELSPKGIVTDILTHTKPLSKEIELTLGKEYIICLDKYSFKGRLLSADLTTERVRLLLEDSSILETSILNIKEEKCKQE